MKKCKTYKNAKFVLHSRRRRGSGFAGASTFVQEIEKKKKKKNYNYVKDQLFDPVM